jgi:Bacterial regulatory proteins, tetR family
MPRSSAENDRIREATSEHILKTALSLFCDKRYDATSIEEIAKQAQISQGLLYHSTKKRSLLSSLSNSNGRIGKGREVIFKGVSIPLKNS